MRKLECGVRNRSDDSGTMRTDFRMANPSECASEDAELEQEVVVQISGSDDYFSQRLLQNRVKTGV